MHAGTASAVQTDMEQARKLSPMDFKRLLVNIRDRKTYSSSSRNQSALFRILLVEVQRTRRCDFGVEVDSVLTCAAGTVVSCDMAGTASHRVIAASEHLNDTRCGEQGLFTSQV